MIPLGHGVWSSQVSLWFGKAEGPLVPPPDFSKITAVVESSAGTRRPFVSDLRWGRVIKLGLMRGTEEGQMHRPSVSDV